MTMTDEASNVTDAPPTYDQTHASAPSGGPPPAQPGTGAAITTTSAVTSATTSARDRIEHFRSLVQAALEAYHSLPDHAKRDFADALTNIHLSRGIDHVPILNMFTEYGSVRDLAMDTGKEGE